MDDAAKQLLRYERESLPLNPGQPVREDYHYERWGVQAIIVFFDPNRGWCLACLTETRNTSHNRVYWRFITRDARIHLRHLYTVV